MNGKVLQRNLIIAWPFLQPLKKPPSRSKSWKIPLATAILFNLLNQDRDLISCLYGFIIFLWYIKRWRNIQDFKDLCHHPERKTKTKAKHKLMATPIKPHYWKILTWILSYWFLPIGSFLNCFRNYSVQLQRSKTSTYTHENFREQHQYPCIYLTKVWH